MSEETLVSAARRAVRFFRIDMEKGGIITVATQQAVETLAMMLEKETNSEMSKMQREEPRT